MTVRNGRFIATIDRPVTVFMLGMRFNRLWKVRSWLPVFRAMPQMLGELYRQKDLGFLGGTTWLTWRGIMMVQFWESAEKLHAYARSSDNEHLPAWKAFNQAIGGNGDVGLWHETYDVQSDQVESIYANVPEMGLAAALGSEAVGQRRNPGFRRAPVEQTA